MAAIPGSVPLTGKVAPTDTTDTFATHMDIYGEGGYMAVADTAARNLITEDRRKLGMAVCTTTDNKIYTLTTNPASATTVDGDWTEFTSGSSADWQTVMDSGSTATGLTSNVTLSTSGKVNIVGSSGASYTPTLEFTDVSDAFYLGCTLTDSLQTRKLWNMGGQIGVWADAGASGMRGRVFATYLGNARLECYDPITAGGQADGIIDAMSGSGSSTGRIFIAGSGMGTPQVGDTLSVNSTHATSMGPITGADLEWQPGVQTTKVTLSNAEIQALDVTPIELVAAPGAGKFIQLLSVYGFLDYTAPAFNSVNLRIRSFGSSSYLGNFNTAFTSSSADKKETWQILAPGSWIDNTKIEIYATGATGAGGSTIDVYLTYIIIDL